MWGRHASPGCNSLSVPGFLSPFSSRWLIFIVTSRTRNWFAGHFPKDFISLLLSSCLTTCPALRWIAPLIPPASPCCLFLLPLLSLLLFLLLLMAVCAQGTSAVPGCWIIPTQIPCSAPKCLCASASTNHADTRVRAGSQGITGPQSQQGEGRCFSRDPTV